MIHRRGFNSRSAIKELDKITTTPLGTGAQILAGEPYFQIVLLYVYLLCYLHVI